MKDGQDGKDGRDGKDQADRTAGAELSPPSRLSHLSAPAFPHPLTLLVGCVLVAAALTWFVPAGEFQRREDPATGRSVAIAGTYTRTESRPVGPFQAVVAIPKGIVDAASVIGLVFLIGGAFAVVERTGTLGRLANGLARWLRGRRILVIPVASLAFSLGGIMMQMQEELIAFVPVLLLLTRQLGFDPVTAVAMSLGPAAVGAAFSPVNPFQVIIAQKVAELPPASGFGFRVAFLLPALGLWIAGTMYYATRTRRDPVLAAEGLESAVSWRDLAILFSILAAFAVYVYGAQRLGWEFYELAAVFFVVGVLAGAIGRLGTNATAEGFVDGFRAMAFASLVIGFARAIYVVLSEGRIIDTLVRGLAAPLADLPTTLSAFGMLAAQTAIHVPVPSTSGQAVLTLPLLVPLSDLIGLSRQVTVLAYQYGAGLCDLITPTNGALMAMLAAAGVRYDQWLKLAGPLYLLLIALSLLALMAAVSLGLS